MKRFQRVWCGVGSALLLVSAGAALAQDGAYAPVSSENVGQLEVLHTFDLDGLLAVNPTVSGDGQWAAALLADPQGAVESTVIVWDLNTDEAVYQYEVGNIDMVNMLEPLAFSPDSATLFFIHDMNQLVVIDMATGDHIGGIRTDTTTINAFDISDDSNQFAIAFSDGYVEVGDLEAEQMVNQWDAHDGERVLAVEFLPDNRLISEGLDGFARVWNLDESEPEQVTEFSINGGIGVQDDGSAFIYTDSDLNLYRVDLEALTEDLVGVVDDDFHPVALSQDGSMALAFNYSEGALAFYDMNTGAEIDQVATVLRSASFIEGSDWIPLVNQNIRRLYNYRDSSVIEAEEYMPGVYFLYQAEDYRLLGVQVTFEGEAIAETALVIYGVVAG